VIGIGQEMRGDDAAGPEVARRLVARSRPPEARPALAPTLLILDAGPAPENQTGPLRRFAPDLVILVDAARMEEPPGAVRWLPWQETAGLSGSTHTLPPSMLATYLTAELGCEVALLGIQPQAIDFDAPLSTAADQAVEEVVAGLAEILQV
jgi:hydrogenase 3 maturation protease